MDNFQKQFQPQNPILLCAESKGGAGGGVEFKGMGEVSLRTG